MHRAGGYQYVTVIPPEVASGFRTAAGTQVSAPGSSVSGRLVRHDDRAGGGEHAADATADRDLGVGDLGRVSPPRGPSEMCISWQS